MVNDKRLKKKLPSLLVDIETTFQNPEGWNEYKKKAFRLSTFEKKEPTKFNSFMQKVIHSLEEMDEGLYQGLTNIESKHLTGKKRKK